VLRNASGSGADGKFSLAAFNYQNGSAVEATEDGTKHDSVVVQQGENYTKISKRVYGTTRYFSALAVFNQNRIPDPSKMRPGMIVLTPEAHILEERYPQLFVDLQPRVTEPAMFMLLEDGSPAYRVGERETLSEISKRYLGRSSRWVEIYQMNESAVKDPNKLKPGTILALPNDAAEVNVMQ
jgi:nucleoid-associated protein YgaU